MSAEAMPMTDSPLDKVTMLGVLLFGFALAVPAFVTYRPSRIVRGEPLSALESAGPAFWALVALLLVMALAATSRGSVLRGMPTALVGAVAAATVVWVVGLAAQGLVTSEAPYARVSLSAGFWLALFGAYLVVVGGLRGYGGAGSAALSVGIMPLASVAVMLVAGHLDDLSIMREFFNRRGSFLSELSTHVTLSFSAVGAGTVIGLILAFVIFRYVATERYLFFFVNLFQTIPTLSFLGLLMAPLAFLAARYAFLRGFGISAIGWAPAFIVLFAYTLLPVTSNALAGFRIVEPRVLEAARGMGMTGNQVFWRIQLPLALPVIVSGVRTALTQAIGNTILAGLIGGGGMGTIIFLGLAQAAPDLILLGTIPVVILALVADYAMKGLSEMLSRSLLRGSQ